MDEVGVGVCVGFEVEVGAGAARSAMAVATAAEAYVWRAEVERRQVVHNGSVESASLKRVSGSMGFAS